MANTITTSTQVNGRVNVIYLTLQSDGTNETGTVIYDSSVIATAAGITDTLTCRIEKISFTTNAAATARIRLLFDATTDVVALCLPSAYAEDLDFLPYGGLNNTAGTGKTGDILLTTTGLASGDTITIVLQVRV